MSKAGLFEQNRFGQEQSCVAQVRAKLILGITGLARSAGLTRSRPEYSRFD